MRPDDQCLLRHDAALGQGLVLLQEIEFPSWRHARPIVPLLERPLDINKEK
jgi:hypothetical protein